MELRLYLRMLLRGWWIIALTALTAVIIALFASYMATPLYQANARLIISPNAASKSNNEVLYGLDILDKRSIVTTYSEVLNSRQLFAETIAALRLSAAASEEYTRRAVVLPDSNIIDLTVTGPDPKMATLLANTIGQSSIDYVNSLYQNVYQMHFLDPATVPTEPVSPQPMRDVALALVLGLLAGAVLAILSEQLRVPFQSLMHRTQMDVNSSVYNRVYFERLIRERIRRQPSQVLALGLVQMDGLEDMVLNQPKSVTNPLLRQITQIMRNELRGNDLIGRWSDDEFAILLPSTPAPAAVATFERIAKTLAEPLPVIEQETLLQFRPCVGVATRQGNELSDTLIQDATVAMERARESNVRVILFSPAAKPVS